MNNIIGVSGFIYTGSGAILDLLSEFNDAQVLNDIEFNITYFPDGLEDLNYHLNNFNKYMSSVVAINRFRKLTNWPHYIKYTNGKIKEITDNFLNKIIQITWNGYGHIDKLTENFPENILKKYILKIINKLNLNKYFRIYLKTIPYKMEFSLFPDNFYNLAKEYVLNVLDSLGRNNNFITILNQPFESSNPIKSFKYFNNPKAIIVNRDPRDHYLFVKNYLRPKGSGFQIPCENIDTYIKYYKLTHLMVPDLKNQPEILFINFEDLIFNYKKTLEKIKIFTGLSQHNKKGMFFKPSKSRNNTKLFLKYQGYENEIMKIENELSEYLFNYNEYDDIEPEGDMFL